MKLGKLSDIAPSYKVDILFFSKYLVQNLLTYTSINETIWVEITSLKSGLGPQQKPITVMKCDAV